MLNSAAVRMMTEQLRVGCRLSPLTKLVTQVMCSVNVCNMYDTSQ